MSKFATATVVKFRGHAPRGSVAEMTALLEKNSAVGPFQIEHRPGLLVVSADVWGKSFYQAGGDALLALDQTLEAVGWDRATLLVENSIVPVLGSLGFRRPTGLSQLGYAA